MSNTRLTSEAAETVARFINSTASHLFLTGKAGTGKTTFLRNLATKTHKNFIVVAPTGIAALNAGGVTIHSQFLFPMGMFLPDQNITADFDGKNIFNADILARRHPLNSQRKQVLRSIDLLVIDEVSMLRADLLDAIDYRLKAARRNFRQSFGGVQILFIGDLFQLPPVVSRSEESLMAQYYPSPWFFEAKGLINNPPVYIELDKIFRQHDEKFIGLLNNLRNNIATNDDINTLNHFYKTEVEIRDLKEIITLTTHNYKADELNQNALQELKSPSHTFEAEIEGDFPESMFPVLQNLVLKVGAQIMFIKNDIDKMYFNGKLATVINIEDDEVEVELAESHLHYTLKRERWENKKYTVNTEQQDLEEEVVGSFQQFPVKLAWAITVHKSQGLTFERAIIDVGQAFADGQVYVALSRLRSLDGLVLRSLINTDVISTDRKIVAYSEGNNMPEKLPALMRQEQLNYLRLELNKAFDFTPITKEIAWFKKSYEEESLGDDMKPVPTQIDEGLQAEKINSEKFVSQLNGLWREGNGPKLIERIEKGTAYYKEHIIKLLKLLLAHIQETQQLKRVKTYLSHLNELDQMLSKKLEDFERVIFLSQAMAQQSQAFDFSERQKELRASRAQLMQEIQATSPTGAKPKPKKKKSKKNPDGKSTYDITLDLIQNGKSLEEIAKERELAVGTIESHIAVLVGQRRLDIHKVVGEEDIAKIVEAASSLPEEHTSKDIYEKLKGKYSYGIIRAVTTYKNLYRPME